jgi:hypothetical protein
MEGDPVTGRAMADRVMHVSRHWTGPGAREEECPCPKEPCGFVDTAKAVPECQEHPPNRCKSIRDSHWIEQCPGRGAR